MESEMTARGWTPDTHPMVGSFIETHATLLRDFVFARVSLSHQFRLEEIERLLGDKANLLRVIFGISSGAISRWREGSSKATFPPWGNSFLPGKGLKERRAQSHERHLSVCCRGAARL
jgi:hypothetical protein